MKNKGLSNRVIIAVISFITIICSLLFGHSDLLVTAQRSLLYLKGSWQTIWGNLWDNFAHFYTNSYSLTGDYGANYLPSTFLLFAIWNIPYKLFADASIAWGEWSVAFQLWNKLLPTLFYVATCFVFYKICKDNLHLDEEESIWGMLVYAISPIAFFCQFIFFQYDIFTVFFLVLGIYYWFKPDRTYKDYGKFILFMGISSTFKYFTLIILAVLLILENKNIVKCLIFFILGCMPILMEAGFYLVTDSQNFIASVIEFQALEFAGKSGVSVGFATIKLLPLAVGIILILAYKTKITNQEHLHYSIFFCVCMCAALFGLMSWHPQWLLFAIPFWALALIINQDKAILLVLDIAFSVFYIGYVVSKFTNNVDQNLLKYGVFTKCFRFKINLPVEEGMSKYFPFNIDMMFTALVTIMVAYCILTNPQSHRNSENKITIRGYKHGIIMRYTIGVLTFLIPMGLCVPQLLSYPELLWQSWPVEQEAMFATNFLAPEDDNTVQYIQGVGNIVSEVRAYTVCPYGIPEGLEMSLSIVDVATGSSIGDSTVDGGDIANGDMTIFKFENIKIEPDGMYEFIFRCNQAQSVHMAYMLEPVDSGIQINTVKFGHAGDVLAVDHVSYNEGTLYMQIIGRKDETKSR